MIGTIPTPPDPESEWDKKMAIGKLKDRGTLLDQAKDLINGDRKHDYGDARVDFAKIATMWSAIFGVPVEPFQVPLAMICVKISRHLHRQKPDNIADLAGYAGLLELFLPTKAK